jgi:paraquat-inducible protein B
MKKKISPTIIGAFVLGALGLLVAVILILGSGKLFVQSRDFILYFDSSVNGLRVGAPVKFKGVEIGSVKEILLSLSSDMSVQRIPVVVRIDAEKIKKRGGSSVALTDPEVAKALIDQGLRGQLQMESLVTGLLYVGLDFFPDTPAHFVQSAQENSKYMEIPTIPSIFEQAQDVVSSIVARLQEVDFKSLLTSLEQTSSGVNSLVTSPELKASLQGLQKAIPKLEETIVTVRDAAKTLDSNVQTATSDLKQTTSDMRAALKQASDTMKGAEDAIANVKTLVDPDSQTFYELTRSLREVSAAARSMRQLSNYLERNPRALIFGKPETKEER